MNVHVPMLAALAIVAGLALPGAAAGAPGTRDALLVGNNWDGTADVVDTRSHRRLTRIDVVPDIAQRRAEIAADPSRQAAFLLVRQQIGEGHDQLVDDMFSSPDGRTIYVSRPSLADVVAIDLATRRIVWRVKVDGVRADHMAISPDGSRLLVSASTARVVDVIDTRAGRLVARIPSGDQPHESNFSRDGSLIFHASIGTVYTPLDDPALDAAKGERVLEIIDARTLRVLHRIDMAKKLAEFGAPGMSGAIRPMALSPDERFLYVQLSFFHGFAEYDLREHRVTRLARLPLSDASRGLRRDQYLLDSAHHGLAMGTDGTKLCVAGTMSDYAAIVARDSFRHRILPVGGKPYWATNSPDGRSCYVSVSGDDRIAVIDYASEREVARIPVGDHPQRSRTARIATAIFGPPTQLRPESLSLRATGRPGRRVRLTGRLALPRNVTAKDGCRGRVRVELRGRTRRAAAVRTPDGAPARASGTGAPVVTTARTPDGAPARASGTGAPVAAATRSALASRGYARVRRDCSYRRTLRSPVRAVRLTARARFTGHADLSPRASRRVAARR